MGGGGGSVPTLNYDPHILCFGVWIHFSTFKKTPVPPTLFLFPHTPINAHFQGKRKEIRGTHFATQQEINQTQITLATCRKYFQLFFKAFPLAPAELPTFFRFTLLRVAYITCVRFSLTGHRKYRLVFHLQLPLHSTSSKQCWLLQLKTAFHI